MVEGQEDLGSIHQPTVESSPQTPGPEEVIGTIEEERIRTGEMIGSIMSAKEGTEPISVGTQIDRMDILYHRVASRFDELLDGGDYNPVLAERSTVVGMRLGRLTSDHPEDTATVQHLIDARATERNQASAARKAVKEAPGSPISPTPGSTS